VGSEMGEDGPGILLRCGLLELHRGAQKLDRKPVRDFLQLRYFLGRDPAGAGENLGD